MPAYFPPGRLAALSRSGTKLDEIWNVHFWDKMRIAGFDMSEDD